MQFRLSLIVGDFIQSARNAGQSVSGTAGAATKPMTALEGLKVVGADLGRAMVTTAGIRTAAMTGWTANAFAAGVAYNSLQQTAGSALETLMESAEAATAQMEELTSFTLTSSFLR